MIHRYPPKCIFCGKIIATAVRDKESRIIGDNFIRWEYEKHNCEEGRKFAEKASKALEKLKKEQKNDKQDSSKD